MAVKGKKLALLKRKLHTLNVFIFFSYFLLNL